MRRFPLLTKVRMLLFVASLMTAIGIPAAGRAAEMMHSGTYATAQVLGDAMLLQDLSTASKETQEDIEQIYAMGRPSNIQFTDADWVLSPEGVAVMRVSFTVTGRTRPLMASGSWGTHANNTFIHLVGHGPRDLLITLDGLLEAQGDTIVLDGIWTASLRGVHHVERVRLRLVPRANDVGWAAAILQAERTNLKQRLAGSRHERLLSAPTSWIGGVPVGASFDLTLDVVLDGIALPSMAGKLLLNAEQAAGEPHVSATISTNGATVPGWSTWSSTTVGAHGFVSQPGVTVTVANGVLTEAIEASPLSRGLISWWVRNPEHPEETAPVLVKRGEITLKMTRDSVEGSIEAVGTVMAGNHPKSVFKAVVHGTRVAKKFIAGTLNVMGRRTFDGRWTDKIRHGEIVLRQDDHEVSGSFEDFGHVQGTVSGRVADIAWRSPNGKSGGGFIATTGTGLLVGLTWAEGAVASADAVVALQHFNKILRSPSTDDEANELKWVGYDLAAAGKHAEAAE